MDNDDYIWCVNNKQYLEARAFLSWCEASVTLGSCLDCKYIKEAYDKLDSLYDDIWCNLFDLRESLDD